MALSATYEDDAAKLPCADCSNKSECAKHVSTCIAYNRYLDGKRWTVGNRIPNRNINMELF